jgi:hypothetical protein
MKMGHVFQLTQINVLLKKSEEKQPIQLKNKKNI